jgi:hypothetical protein
LSAAPYAPGLELEAALADLPSSGDPHWTAGDVEDVKRALPRLIATIRALHDELNEREKRKKPIAPTVNGSPWQPQHGYKAGDVVTAEGITYDGRLVDGVLTFIPRKP